MSRVVYVGHVPFDMTEEQIEDIFRSAGPVEQTRLVFDRMTGKSKGFAFVQYYEPESAASAVRNLDNYKIGSMHLKVNYSAGRFPGGGNNNNNQNSQNNNNNNNNNNNQNNNQNTQNKNRKPDQGAVEHIVNTVNEIPLPLKLEMLKELKALIVSKRDDALLVMNQNPQLAYAIVQCLFELGIIDGNMAGTLILPPQAPSSDATSDADQKLIQRQIMQLSPEQINAMPADQRNAALAIRQQAEYNA